MSRKVEMETLIAATPEEVWRALTDAGELVKWFPPDAKVRPGPGGAIWMSWGPGIEGEARIEAWEPPRRLLIADPTAEASGRAPILTEWILEGRSGSTSVRLVTSGFGDDASFDDEIESLRRGWIQFLYNLRHLLENHRGQPGASTT